MIKIDPNDLAGVAPREFGRLVGAAFVKGAAAERRQRERGVSFTPQPDDAAKRAAAKRLGLL